MSCNVSMKGRRLPDTDEFPQNMEKGDYVKYKGEWHMLLPNGQFVSPRTWTPVEHDDGTLSLTPSIQTLPTTDEDSWHGHLIRGEFISC